MTIAVSTSRASYVGNGVTLAFPVPFTFDAAGDLRVTLEVGGVVTALLLNSGYSVTGAGNEQGGQVLCAVAPPVAAVLRIVRATARTQLTDYVPNDPFPADSHERALDKLTRIDQEQDALLVQAVQLPETEVGPMTLPGSQARAGRVLAFGGGGAAIAGPLVATLETVAASLLPAVAPAASTVMTVAAMRAIAKAGLAPGAVVYCHGYHAAGDLGGGPFRWEPANVAAADGGFVLSALEGGAGRWVRLLSGPANIAMFGAIGDANNANAAGNTAAIEQCFASIYARGGGFMDGVPGIFVHNGLDFYWAQQIPVNFRGPGLSVMVLRKAPGTLPGHVLRMRGFAGGGEERYVGISGMNLQCADPGDAALLLEDIARVRVDRIKGQGGAVHLDMQSALQVDVSGCDFGDGANIGLRTRRKGAGIFPNFIRVQDTRVQSAASYGCDVGHGDHILFDHVDFSANGTAGNFATGAVLLRSTLGVETGYSTVTFSHCWWEGNKGLTVQNEANVRLSVSFYRPKMYANEGGVSIFTARHFAMRDGDVPGASEPIFADAAQVEIVGGALHTVTLGSAAVNWNIKTSTALGQVQWSSSGVLVGAVQQLELADGPGANEKAIRKYGAASAHLLAGSTKRLTWNGTGLGFNGATPVAPAALPAPGADPLANAIRALLIANGLATA